MLGPTQGRWQEYVSGGKKGSQQRGIWLSKTSFGSGELPKIDAAVACNLAFTWK